MPSSDRSKPSTSQGMWAVSVVEVPAREVMAGEAAELGAEVGRPVERLAVPGEADVVVRHGRPAGSGSGSQRPGLARRDVDEVDVGLVDRERLDGRNRLVVGRPVGDGPVPLDVLDPPGRTGPRRIDDVEVHVPAVAGVAAIGQQRPGVGPLAHHVPRLAVGEPLDLPGAEVVEEELIILGAPRVGAEGELIAPGPWGRAQHAIAPEGELGPGASGEGDVMDLGRLREPGGDQDLATGRPPTPGSRPCGCSGTG